MKIGCQALHLVLQAAVMMKDKIKIIIFAIWAVFLSETATVQAAVIAVSAPKSGDGAMFGEQLADGARIAVEEINDNGGLLGEKIEFIAVDDASSDLAVKSEEQLLTSSGAMGRLDLIVGPWGSDYFELISDVYAKNGITHMVVQPLDEQRFGYKATGMFKIGGLVAAQAESVLAVYKERWSDKNIAVAYDKNNVATYETAAALQGLMQANGIGKRISLYDFADYAKIKKMAKEIAAKSKVVYILGNKNQVAELAQKLQDRNEEIVLIVDEYMATSYFFKEMGNFAEGVYVLKFNDQKANSAFTKELVELRIKGREPRGLGIMSYTAVMLWRDMAEAAKSFDVGKIAKIANERNWNTPWGMVGFKDGAVVKGGGWNMYLLENGEYTQVN
ncbi:MAG: ABC transporter substrate-binding protein [Alphaproteobacteria bacterium]|nr:ABC transporter substrate-binding protein [Alphaproteobacteria bacterium]